MNFQPDASGDDDLDLASVAEDDALLDLIAAGISVEGADPAGLGVLSALRRDLDSEASIVDENPMPAAARARRRWGMRVAVGATTGLLAVAGVTVTAAAQPGSPFYPLQRVFTAPFASAPQTTQTTQTPSAAVPTVGPAQVPDRKASQRGVRPPAPVATRGTTVIPPQTAAVLTAPGSARPGGLVLRGPVAIEVRRPSHAAPSSPVPGGPAPLPSPATKPKKPKKPKKAPTTVASPTLGPEKTHKPPKPSKAPVPKVAETDSPSKARPAKTPKQK